MYVVWLLLSEVLYAENGRGFATKMGVVYFWHDALCQSIQMLYIRLAILYIASSCSYCIATIRDIVLSTDILVEYHQSCRSYKLIVERLQEVHGIRRRYYIIIVNVCDCQVTINSVYHG